MNRDQKKAQKLLKEADRFSLHNRNGKASKRYEQALALDPTNLDLITAYAIHNDRQQNYTKSAELWDAAIENDPGNYLAYICSGNAYKKLEKYNMALDRLNSASTLDSDDQLF